MLLSPAWNLQLMGPPTAISLFAGCGGDTLGLARAGFRVSGFVENWVPAIQSHLANFRDCAPIGAEAGGDIARIPDAAFEALRGEVDLLFAGFPCQGFSHAGKKDPNDARNRLFWEFVRAAELIQPRWIVGENVFGLLRRMTDDGRTPVSEVILRAFKDIGYAMAAPAVLNAADFGVAQRRKRVFFVGSRDGVRFGPPSGNRRLRVGVRTAVEYAMEGAMPFDPRAVSGEVGAYCESFPAEEPAGRPHPYLASKLAAGLVSAGKRISPFHVEVVDLDAPSKTIHSGYRFQPRLFVPLRNPRGTFLRTFTPRELARLQGFPEEFQFRGSEVDVITQIGNAVPPPLVSAVARQIAVCDGALGEQLSVRTGLRLWAESAPIS